MISHEQKAKADTLLKLHHSGDPLVLTNAWDPGSARVVAASGAKAIATTSMGIAASLGYPDRQMIPVHEMAEAIERIVAAVRIPVTADIEAGYGRDLDEILEHITDLMATGIVGGNLEDSSEADIQLLDADEFCERLRAIRSLSESFGFHFVINARTDVFMTNAPIEDRIGEAIRRGNKYLEAGADCIFIPNAWEEDKIIALVNGINGPVNILVNPTNGLGLPPSVERLKEIGVARISFGSSIMKTTLTLLKKIVDEVAANGTYEMLYNITQPLATTQEAYKMATTA